MLSELGVSVILEASITGAGLVLAVYALLTPLSRRIFIRRAKMLDKKIKEFEETKNIISPSSSPKEIKKLQNLREEIEEWRIMPPYFRMEYILGPFVFYLLSVFVALFYLENFQSASASASSAYDFAVFWFFMIANLLFLLLGFGAIIGTYLVMKEQFESIKERQKEVKETKVSASVSVAFRGDAEVKEKKDS